MHALSASMCAYMHIFYMHVICTYVRILRSLRPHYEYYYALRCVT
ncbi:hypothetical protein HMPREF9248_0530 [Fannyhessea vaginae PB189-T1-4]|uniref:Uncharacterized protein n=1 Tax=Fannyhessea vaginae PB189-T1-4 TaxID=866774 RepID=A0ABN0AZE5_9ACTN|nr:hypothetical protein HMPREF9248_0530 [Fannyhessea vaginae PB189-T1-4]